MILTDQGLLDWMEELSTKRFIYDSLKSKFEQENAELIESIKEIEEDIKAYVLKKGETVKSDTVTAVWNKGKTTWDGKLLEGYSIAHPDILAAKKVGNPTVSIQIKRKDK